MSFLTNIEKDADLVVSKVDHFFAHLLTQKTWQAQFSASVQALAGTVEGVVEITGNEAEAAQIQSVVNTINEDFGTLTGLVASYNTAAPQTFVAQATTTINLIKTNMGSILQLVDVKNTNTVNQVTGVTTVVAAGLEALLALVPIAQAQAAAAA